MQLETLTKIGLFPDDINGMRIGGETCKVFVSDCQFSPGAGSFPCAIATGDLLCPLMRAYSFCMATRLLLICSLLFSLAAPVAAGTDPQRAIDLIEQASDKSNIFELPSFRMAADVTIDNFGKPVSGKYVLLWNGPEQWREEISLPGYSEVEIGAKGVVFLKRTTDYMPYQIFKLHQALGFGVGAWVDGFFSLGPQAKERPKRIHDQKIAGKKSTCIEIQTAMTYAREVCIDQTTGLINRAHGGITDSEPIPLGTKVFPSSIVYRQENRVLVEVHVTELKTGEHFQAAAFDPPAGTTSRPGCMNPVPPRKNRNADPHYPEQDKLARNQGRVGLYAKIDSAGVPQNLGVVLSAAPGLNAASLEAVRQWRYEPATCDGRPVETEVIVEVNYELSGTELPRSH